MWNPLTDGTFRLLDLYVSTRTAQSDWGTALIYSFKISDGDGSAFPVVGETLANLLKSDVCIVIVTPAPCLCLLINEFQLSLVMQISHFYDRAEDHLFSATCDHYGLCKFSSSHAARATADRDFGIACGVSIGCCKLDSVAGLDLLIPADLLHQTLVP